MSTLTRRTDQLQFSSNSAWNWSLQATWYEFDVDEAEDIAQELGARNVPNFSIFKDGFIADGVTGLKPQELERKIKESLE